LSKFEKGKGREIRVERTEYKGKGYLHIREWYQGEGSDKFFPGKGIALPADMAKEVLEAGLAELEKVPAGPAVEEMTLEQAKAALAKLQKMVSKKA
jgi:hypothetical protein